MSLTTRISALALAIASASTFATQVDETIIVTGDRFDTAPEYQLAVVNVIERTDIEQMAPKSVTDLLQILPGVSVINAGGAGNSSSIFIRGTNSNQALVLVDGVRISSATTGTAALSSLSPEQIERIEVVKGPRAAVWGSDAVGGVVQIFTRKLEQGEWYAGTEVGSDDFFRASAGVGIGNSSLTVSHEQSQGFDVKNDTEGDKDGYERLSVALKGEQALTDQFSLSWVGQVSQGDYDYDNQYSDWMTGELVQDTNEAEYRNHLWNVAGEYQTEIWTSRLELAQSRDFNENTINGDDSAGANVYETRRDQISWTNQFDLESLTLNAGADWYNESISGEFAVDERDLVAAFGLARYELNQWLFEAAVRYDDVENIDSEVTYNASVAYRFNDDWRVTTSAGTGFRAPTFNDLYWPGSGNPDLVSETSDNYELGLHYAGENLSGYASVFYNQIDNLIAWAPNSSGMWQPANINEAEILGLELSLAYTLFGLDHQLAYTYLDAEDTKANTELLGRSEHELDYAISYNWDRTDVRLGYHYQGKRYDGDSNFDGKDDYLGIYHDVDLSVGYQIDDNWQIRGTLNNLLDEDIISNADYYDPGRQWFVSLTYQAF